MRAGELKTETWNKNGGGKGGIMIELGSKTLFFINLIIHGVAKCGETMPTASARLFIRLLKSRTRAFVRSVLRRGSLERAGEV
jgi:hypothetical protein